MPFRKININKKTTNNQQLIVLTWSRSTRQWLFPINMHSRERLITLFALLGKKNKRGYPAKPRVNFFDRKAVQLQAWRKHYKITFHNLPTVAELKRLARTFGWESEIPEQYLDPSYIPTEAEAEKVPPGPKAKQKDPLPKKGPKASYGDYFPSDPV